MRRREFLQQVSLSAPLLAATASAGCASTRPSRLIVSTYPRIAMSGLYLADEIGLFKQQGLEVDLREVPTSSHALAMLVGGETDVMFASLMPAIVNAVAKGSRIRLVAGREIASASCGNVGTIYGNSRVFPDGLRDLGQLRGKRISVVAAASSAEFFLDTILATAGMTSKEVHVVYLRQQEGAAALVGGKIDALISSHFEKSLESLTTQAIKGISIGEVYPGLQYSFIFFGRRLTDDEPEIGTRFLTAYLLGAKAYLEGKNPRYLYRLIRAAHLDLATTLRQCRQTFAADGNIDLKSVRIYVDWAVKKRYCEPIEARRFVNTKLIAEAQKRASPTRS